MNTLIRIDRGPSPMPRKNLSVTGMSCGGCEQTVETALEDLDGVGQVKADHEDGTVEFDATDDVTEKTIHEAIEQAGYDVTA